MSKVWILASLAALVACAGTAAAPGGEWQPPDPGYSMPAAQNGYGDDGCSGCAGAGQFNGCGCPACGLDRLCGRCAARKAAVGNFNCSCRGSYKFPVPPQYTYHWPGMYSQQTMTEYSSPFRFPPLKLPRDVFGDGGIEKKNGEKDAEPDLSKALEMPGAPAPQSGWHAPSRKLPAEPARLPNGGSSQHEPPQPLPSAKIKTRLGGE